MQTARAESSMNPMSEEIIESGLVSSLQESFANGTYPEWLAKEVFREENAPHILQEIEDELEAMRALTPAQRMEEYNWIVRYYSRSNVNFESTSLRLYDYIGCSEDDIEAGTYKARAVGVNLLTRMRNYDRHCVIPIITQIRQYLVKDFSDANILFLGRDFCSAYLYIVNEGALDRDNLFLSNISRYVRDVTLGGKFTELRLVLERIGLTRERLLEKGLLITDSCMQGKIPAVILKSLALGMNETERYTFLKKCGVRYLKSSRLVGMTISEKTELLGVKPNGEKLLTDNDINVMFSRRIERIEEFPVEYPAIVAEYVPRRHKIFEWRPKVTKIAMGIAIDQQGPRLISDSPRTSSEKVLTLLGLYAEIQLAKAATQSRIATLPLFNSQSAPVYIGPHVVTNSLSVANYTPPPERDPAWFLKEIDVAAKEGIEALRNWQTKEDSNIGSVAVMRTPDLEFKYELVVNGKTIYRFKDIVGEGSNVKVYQTGSGTIVKVIKDARHLRKNLMLVWAEPLVHAVGIHTARIVDVSPTGLYLEQEIIPGPSLESLYSETAIEDIPEHIREKVLHDFRAAKRLIQEKGIWLDLKSANYHVCKNAFADDKIVNVDYGPRLNVTFYRYFQNNPPGYPTPNEADKEKRTDFNDNEFLECFFHYDVKKRKALAEAKALTEMALTSPIATNE